jgi:hypothetical protein
LVAWQRRSPVGSEHTFWALGAGRLLSRICALI